MAAEQTSLTLHDLLGNARKLPCTTQIVRDSDGQKRKFPGVEVGYTSSRWIAGREQSRWTERTLYALADGRFVLAVERHTPSQVTYYLTVFNNVEEVMYACSLIMLSITRRNLQKKLLVKSEEEEAIPL